MSWWWFPRGLSNPGELMGSCSMVGLVSAPLPMILQTHATPDTGHLGSRLCVCSEALRMPMIVMSQPVVFGVPKAQPVVFGVPKARVQLQHHIFRDHSLDAHVADSSFLQRAFA